MTSLSLSEDDVAGLKLRVAALMPQVRADLERLVRIPSVNFPGYDLAPVHECAQAVAELLREAGAADVELVASSSGVQTVLAEVPGPPGSPRVLLYSHYDVVPVGEEGKWTSPPFEPVDVEGRLHGRGAADDKSGVVSHIAMLRAFEGHPPVSLRIVIEGEEEYGGEFEEWPTTRPGTFEDVDVALIADMGNVELGLPTFTTVLRGIVEGVVTVRTLAEPRHSGSFGGPAPDALMVLIKLLSTLMDDRGDATIDGITGTEWPGAEYPEEAYRELAGVLPGVPRIGSRSIASHLFSMPSVSVVGLDAPEVDTAPNALTPSARAKISVRIPAGVDAEEATELLRQHVLRHAPWGVAVEFEAGPPANGTALPMGGPAQQSFAVAAETAYSRPTTQQGMGGAVPFVANLIQEFPDLEVLGVGAQDPLARIHAPNESIQLRELQDSIVAEALFLADLGNRVGRAGV
jgi:acetylornithine deacetylase/succinyl-diaminopimelate desuccinylase-like protein